MPSSSPVAVKTALLSVSNKSGLTEFATRLTELGITLLSTGGTAKALREAGLEVVDVSEVTEFPEIMDGRVKTLHPKIHGGLLAKRDDRAHLDAAALHDISMIDLVVINLYPFAETLRSGADFDRCIENIDIGGPAMVRASAKNHAFVCIVSDPADYEAVATQLETSQNVPADMRQELARKAFAMTA
ncbi:MAG: bifunctional phosphoribosylaminoimidazolecarboxamide formyltransferase/IMP cyclohydrolase, partial [Candidatus Puniceispirillaceae bacterium]